MPDENVSPVTWKRWLVLFVIVLLNVTNSILWLSYASIYENVAKEYEISERQVNLFSLVFCISTVFVGLPVVWLVDKKGLRSAILLGALLNFVGAFVRMLNNIWNKYEVAMAGQVLASLAQPFLYCVPTKVAEQWFPDHQRALATSLGILANLFGQLIGCGITPLIVPKYFDIKKMDILYGAPCVVAVLIAFVCIRSSKPENPPSNSAAISTNYPYISALRSFLPRKESLFLMCGVGSVLGVSYTLMSRMSEILCTKGYDMDIIGYCTICLMCSGLVGGIIASILADKTRKFILILNICLTAMVIFLCLFVVVVSIKKQNNVLILATCGLVGFWSYAAFPVGLELAMEHSFTVLPEATSSGLVIITGQFLSMLYFMFFETLTEEENIVEGQTCSKPRYGSIFLHSADIKPLDCSRPLYILAGITTLFVATFILFFKSDYNRMKTENRSMSAIVNDDDPILSNTSFEDPSWHTSIYS